MTLEAQKAAAKELIEMGYPERIKGNGGRVAVLVGVQPFF